MQEKLTYLPEALKPLFISHLKQMTIDEPSIIKKTDGFTFLPASLIQKILKKTGCDKTELGLVLLPLAASYAVAPISNFKVGAIAFDSNNNAYLGANFEFANTHIGQTIHAEQSAIAHAWMQGAKNIDRLIINYPPCGHCRQFINEVRLTKTFKIVLPNTNIKIPKPLSYYLPDDFSGIDLGITQKILDEDHHHDGTDEPLLIKDDCKRMAFEACKTSHAPYSHNHNGIALEFADGSIISGRYAENAAFNPSLPALQVALNFRRMQGKNWQHIQKAIMVEQKAKFSQKANTQQLLASINSKIDLQYFMIT